VKIAVLGAGAWGSALAISLAAHHDVALWTRDPGAAEALERQRASAYLPQCPFPAALCVAPRLEGAVNGADLVLIATSTAGLRPVAQAVARIDASPDLLWACKGFEAGSDRLPHEIVAETLPQARHVGALSGPSFALEVARGLPTALVVASRDAEYAAALVAALNTPRLRLYSSADVPGVELGGAIKNVIAIAAGIADGLELGRNARAALVTRGLAEITRLGLAMGGQAQTFAGLAGLGDLVLTCTGELSRNREVGLRLAAGRPLAAILDELGHVAEGVHSARSAFRQAQARGVDMPITAGVHAVLFEDRPTRAVVEGLLARDPKPEKA
jgi:glycerol-3-phosphate dehydrogenase (NAD(P)+)